MAFTYGEKLRFKIAYGIIDAGYAELEVKPTRKKTDKNYYHVIGKGYSNYAFDWFFKIRDRYESIIDSTTLNPVEFIREVNEGNTSFKQNYHFDQSNQTVYDGKKEIATPKNIQDMVSCYFYARNLELKNLKKGDILSFPTFVDGESYDLKCKFLGEETVEISAGKFNALKFCPVVQKGRIFDSEESLSVWISNDYNKIPLLVKAKILFGSLRMELIEMNKELNPLSLLE